MKYEAGDRVIVTGKVKRVPWMSAMDEYIGQVGTIHHHAAHREYYDVRHIGPKNNGFFIHEDDLAPAAEPDTFASLEADDV